MAKIGINIAKGSLETPLHIVDNYPEVTREFINPAPGDSQLPKTDLSESESSSLKELVELKAAGEELLNTIENFIVKHVSVIKHHEMIRIAEEIQSLQLALTTEHEAIIRERIESLYTVFRPYTERITTEI